MVIDKTQSESSLELGLYLEAHLAPENQVMDTVINKTQPESSLGIGLYLEALLNPDEQEAVIEAKQEAVTEVKVETKELIGDVDSEIEACVSETEQKNAEQSQIPLWGQKPFKCLLVKTAGINLMIPAMSVSYVERINKKIIRLPLDVEAFRGVVTLRERSIAVIDLFTLVSENTSANNRQSLEVDTHHVEQVIVMDNGEYALACDEVGELITLNTEDISWKKASFNNPAFAGIVSEHLCPIVNIEKVQQQVAIIPFVQSLNNN